MELLSPAISGIALQRKHRRHKSILVPGVFVIRDEVHMRFGVEFHQNRGVWNRKESLIGRIQRIVLGARRGLLLVVQRAAIGYWAFFAYRLALRDFFEVLHG